MRMHQKKHIPTRVILTIVALLILLPVILTVLYSFFSPGEITAFMETRGNFNADSWMEIKLAPRTFSLSQYYNILIEDVSVLKLLVNSAMYTGAILIGQALVIPAMAYALSRFRLTQTQNRLFTRQLRYHCANSAYLPSDLWETEGRSLNLNQ